MQTSPPTGGRVRARTRRRAASGHPSERPRRSDRGRGHAGRPRLGLNRGDRLRRLRGELSLVGLLAISPFIAAAFARPSRVALVGILSAFFALVISTPPHSYGELNHTLRVVTMLAATAVAMWISYLRGQRNVQLWTARSETRNERRRRVAAETAQRMQAMARALTTAADPAQVADAVFAAMRDELRVDAVHLCPPRRTGRPADAPALRLPPRRPDRRGPDLAAARRSGPGRERRLLLRDHRRPAARSAPTSTRPSARTGSGPWPSSPWSCPTTPSAPSSCTGTTNARSPDPTGPSSSPSPAQRPRRSSGPGSRSPSSSTWSAANTCTSSARRWPPQRRRVTWHMPPLPAVGVPWVRSLRWYASRPRESAACPAWPAAAIRHCWPARWCPSTGATRAAASRTAGPSSPASTAEDEVGEDVAAEIVPGSSTTFRRR